MYTLTSWLVNNRRHRIPAWQEYNKKLFRKILKYGIELEFYG